ncbi:MAG: pyruvate ferredoxin oxidoreductase [Desulfomonilaceae bacterium]
MKAFMTGNHAVASAVRLCRPQIVAAYPITPQTPIYEKLSDWDASGELGGMMMRVESEHSAMAACLSASLAGARTFTATSSQGLALMHEMLHFAAGCRTAVVMACVNRTLAAPWAFWSDQTDSLSQRDTGWIQIYVEDNQEALDSTIQAFRLAEEVMLPVMVVLEANFISHFMEPVDIPEQAQVDAFLPAPSLPQRFDPDRPGYVTPTVTQEEFEGYRKMSQEAMNYALTALERIEAEFSDTFGRRYGLVEASDCEDAELILLTTATITSTARVALASLRQKGYRIGLVKLRAFRPFPVAALKKAVGSVRRIAVVERNISLGREGIFCSETKSALSNCPHHPEIQGYLAGIGGTNVSPELIERIVLHALALQQVADDPIWMKEE